METCGPSGKRSASVRVREAHDRIARQGKIPGGGPRWFGWTRIYANPEAGPRKRTILRLDIDETEAGALRDAAERVLRGETIYSIAREWEQRGIRPSVAEHWSEATLANILASPRLAGLREWQGKKYPAQWPAIIDADTHERLARLLSDRPRRAGDRQAAAPAVGGGAVRQVRARAVR